MTQDQIDTQRADVAHILETERGDRRAVLLDELLHASLTVLSCWTKGDLAAAVRNLNVVTDAIQDHDDEVAALEAGWDRQSGTWVRGLSPRESCDPTLKTEEVWLESGALHAATATVALQQDEFRDQLATGGH